jgi:hypothetical protein
MAKAIGPNFVNELKAAGVLGLPFAWGEDGAIQYGAAITPVQQAAIEAVYAAHDPTKPDPVAAAAALIAGGLAVTSAAAPALNGTYGCSPSDETAINGLQTAIGVNPALFPGYFRDKAGTAHVMTAAQFTALAEAILAFVVAVDAALAAALAGGAWAAPAAVANLP